MHHCSPGNSDGKESGRARLVGLPNLEEEGSDKLRGHGALVNPLEGFADRAPVLCGAGGWASGLLEGRWGAGFIELPGLGMGYCGVSRSSVALPLRASLARGSTAVCSLLFLPTPQLTERTFFY